MAIRRSTRGFGRRGRGSRLRPRWTSAFVTLDPAAGALGQNVILSEAAFGTSGTLESECYLRRIVLYGDVFASAAGASLVNCGIVLGNENVTPTFGATHDPGLIDSLVDDEWLWTWQGAPLLDVDGYISTFHIEENLKTNRKVRSNEVLRFVANNATGGAAVSIRVYVRILIIIKS